MSNRLKNYGLWIAVVAFIPLFLDGLSTYDVIVKLPENYEEIIKSLLGILVLLGIINNPTTESRLYKDK